MTSSMSDMKFLCFLLMVINCKMFSLDLFLKITFYKLKRYFSYILCLFVTWSKHLYSHTIVIRSSSLVMYPCRYNLIYDAYNFNLKSFKQKLNRHIKKDLFAMPINKSFKIPFSTISNCFS